ncbi:hypothetical protein PIN31115_00892 [Pandoraea iniqua]|uniref:MarR family transcriptional regulator n=1 Tax=Pandoraea iniqua TaxID=2508288 RepID=A0A5E4SNU1_9BURK|nr:DUF488 family protein [Pandoraea iniqua]VVD76563.1 hypothetical protein PIN31115_00892 [Pandoraea iniqua]
MPSPKVTKAAPEVAPKVAPKAATEHAPRRTAKSGDPHTDLHFKRVYDAASPDDGQRVLADRLWPRGLSKEKAKIDFWAKDVTPSADLRKWFHAHPEQFSDFRTRFLDELNTLDADHNAMLAELRTRLSEGRVTLLTAAHKLEDGDAQTHLHVLRDFLAA